jgi:diacylglycerol kinase family enzyme
MLEEVPSGEHELQLRSQWYQNQTKLVTVKDTQVSKLDFEMAKTFARLEVTTEPEATIMLDGKIVGNGQWQKRMHPGIYELRVEKDRYYTEKRQVEIVAGVDEQLTIELSGKTGSLDVITEPFNAQVFLDGEPEGSTPLTIDNLLIGRYTLTIKKAGYANLSKSVEITENENTEVNEILTDGKELTILTNPSGAEVSVDGKFAGTSPLTTALTYGKHEITAVSGDMEQKKTVAIDKSHAGEITIHLQKQIKITSVPPGAEVYIDDELKGTTPIALSLENRTQVIELKKNGYKEMTETIKELPSNDELSFALNKIRILSGTSYDFQLGFGPEHGGIAYGGRMTLFTNRIFLSAGIGFPAKVQAFDQEIADSHQAVLISDIDTYEPVGRRYIEEETNMPSGEGEQLSNITLSFQVGYQFVSPFPFFVHAGYGGRLSPYYENVYQASADYIPQDSYSTTEIKKGDYFTTAKSYVDGFNSLIFGVDVPIAKRVMLGCEYWSNTETGYTIYLNLGLIL